METLHPFVTEGSRRASYVNTPHRFVISCASDDPRMVRLANTWTSPCSQRNNASTWLAQDALPDVEHVFTNGGLDHVHSDHLKPDH